MKRATETGLIRVLLQALKLWGFHAWRNNTGALPVQGRLVRFGVKGSADIFAVKAGRFLSLEAKMPGRKPTAAQREWARSVTEAGGLALVVSGLDELQRALEAEGLI